MKFFQVDAFAERPFAGNPAAICFPEGQPSDKQLQAIAVENNLSETAFLWPRDDGYDLRWFTPAYEVDLCGHATLASAHVLWQTGFPDEVIRFHTRSGLLTAARVGERIQLNFPAVRAEEVAMTEAMRRAFPRCSSVSAAIVANSTRPRSPSSLKSA